MGASVYLARFTLGGRDQLQSVSPQRPHLFGTQGRQTPAAPSVNELPVTCHPCCSTVDQHTRLQKKSKQRGFEKRERCCLAVPECNALVRGPAPSMKRYSKMNDSPALCRWSHRLSRSSLRLSRWRASIQAFVNDDVCPPRSCDSEALFTDEEAKPKSCLSHCHLCRRFLFYCVVSPKEVLKYITDLNVKAYPHSLAYHRFTADLQRSQRCSLRY